MNATNCRIAIRPIVAMALIGTLAACGGGLSGEYVGSDSGRGAAMTFKGNEVEIELMGQIKAGTYQVKDGKVYLAVDGQTQVARIRDDGCIHVDDFVFGTLCKKK